MTTNKADDVMALRERLAAHLGPDRYRKLLYSLGPTRERRRLLFWQEDLFRRSASDTGITVTGIDDFLQLFADVEDPRIRPANISVDDWAKSIAWHEQQDLIADAAMREAQALHEQAMNLLAESESAAKAGDTPRAQAFLRQAFDLQRRAADRCTSDGRGCGPPGRAH